MEHAIHLCAGHFISDLSPSSVSSIIKKMRKFRAAEAEQLEGSDDEDDNEEDEDTPFTSGDAIGKGLALVKQVLVSYRSSQARILLIELLV